MDNVINLDRLHLHIGQVKMLQPVQREERIVGKTLNWVPETSNQFLSSLPIQMLLILYLARERWLSLGIMCQTMCGGEGR